MEDVEIHLFNKPGQLAEMAELLGKNSVNLEGGGVFQCGEKSIAHFLVEDGAYAEELLRAHGFQNVFVHQIITTRLRQDVPGQLGAFCRKLADEKINILVQYSDHNGQLIIVPDDIERARAISQEWMSS